MGTSISEGQIHAAELAVDRFLDNFQKFNKKKYNSAAFNSLVNDFNEINTKLYGRTFSESDKEAYPQIQIWRKQVGQAYSEMKELSRQFGYTLPRLGS